MTTPGPPQDSNPWAVPSGQQPYPQPPAYAQPPAQPTYAQPPAYWPVYSPTPRPRRRWILWVVLAGVLVVGGCGALVATFGVRAYHDIDGARTVANEFLYAVERGDTAAGQRLLCDGTAPDVVQAAVDAGITSHRVVGISVTGTQFGSGESSRETADVTVDVFLAGGIRKREVVYTAKERGRWRVCGIIAANA